MLAIFGSIVSGEATLPVGSMVGLAVIGIILGIIIWAALLMEVLALFNASKKFE
jgi:hypothetical protein